MNCFIEKKIWIINVLFAKFIFISEIYDNFFIYWLILRKFSDWIQYAQTPFGF